MISILLLFKWRWLHELHLYILFLIVFKLYIAKLLIYTLFGLNNITLYSVSYPNTLYTIIYIKTNQKFENKLF